MNLSIYLAMHILPSFAFSYWALVAYRRRKETDIGIAVAAVPIAFGVVFYFLLFAIEGLVTAPAYTLFGVLMLSSVLAVIASILLVVETSFIIWLSEFIDEFIRPKSSADDALANTN